MDQTTTILIVDDEPANCETMAALLHAQGYQLTFASNGVEALAQMAVRCPDLVLLDVIMPVMDGFAVCRHIRADPKLAEVPIILVTALDDRDARSRGLEAGADDFISKPFNRTEMRSRISAITRLNRYHQLLAERMKFERLANLSPNGLMIVDADGTICLANPAAYQILGMPPTNQLIGAAIQALIAPQAWEHWQLNIGGVLADPTYNVRFETIFLKQNGERVSIEIDAGQVIWALKPATQVIIQDISVRKDAEVWAQRQIERLGALHTSDSAIASAFDLHSTLQIMLNQIATQLNVDAAAILLRKQRTQFFEYSIVCGIDKSALRQTRLRVGEGCGGYVALHRSILRIPSFTSAVDAPKVLPTLDEAYSLYYGVPLFVNGQVEGVLELFNRAALDPSDAWLHLFETLAVQVATVVDHAALFDSMQRTNLDLSLAYDTTLEGWARAMELRDIETEGHARRVVDLTVILADALGVDEEALVQIRRGALLHDIGKMSIPDSILLKPGPLTDEEWTIMRKHPIYAYEMLAPIAYFRPALDIPFYHHEKWDGSGYPHGLAGERIPLAARIFAVVDVWDALQFDRPYRKGWSKARVREHIRSLAGSHFDPQVVDAFLRLNPADTIEAKPAILVVDNPGMFEMLTHGLSDLFTVFVASSSATALEILVREEITVILTEQHLPGLTGVELLERARQVRPSTFGILTGSYFDSAAFSKAFRLGTVRAYVQKPWHLAELRQRVSAVVQQYQVAISHKQPRSSD